MKIAAQAPLRSLTSRIVRDFSSHEVGAHYASIPSLGTNKKRSL
jgi:hypothetical protein